MSAPGAPALERLLARLALEQAAADVFTSDTGGAGPRLFGGLIAAQASVAAARTVDADRPLHSLHAYFLRRGRPGEPLELRVERLKDGRRFTARSVSVHQGDARIFHGLASFAQPQDGIAHEDPMPPAPPPDGLPDWERVRAEIHADDGVVRRPDAFEVRVVDAELDRPDVHGAPRRQIWLRPAGPLPEDPLLHTALLIYASDRSLLRAAARPHTISWRHTGMASLDHALWLHRVPRLGDWMLYASASPAARASRALVVAGLYARDGARVASVAQEGLFGT